MVRLVPAGHCAVPGPGAGCRAGCSRAIGLLSVFFQVKQELNRQEGAHLVVLSLQWVVWGTGKLCKFKLNGCESDWALEGQWSADLMGGGKSNLKHKFRQEFLFTASVNVKCSVCRVRGGSLAVCVSASFLSTNKSWLRAGGLSKGERITNGAVLVWFRVCLWAASGRPGVLSCPIR